MPLYEALTNAMLDSAVRGTALAGHITHVSLHTADPTSAGLREVSGGSPAYARVPVIFLSPAGGVISTANRPTLNVPPGVTVTHVGFWSAAEGGTILASDEVPRETFTEQGRYTLTSAQLDLRCLL